MGPSAPKIRKRRFQGARCVKSKGRDYWYVRPLDNGPEIRLTAESGSIEWEREYLAARGGNAALLPKRLLSKTSSLARITLGEAIERYMRSTTWTDLAAESQAKRRRDFKHFLSHHADARLSDLTQDRLIELMANFAPRQHREHVLTIRMVIRVLNERARANGEASLLDPTQGYPFPKLPQTKGFMMWKPEHIERFRNFYALGTHERTLLELLLGTCQRVSDVCRMRWSHIVDLIGEDGAVHKAIHVAAQEKTKAEVLIPIDADLQQALDAWKEAVEAKRAKICGHYNSGYYNRRYRASADAKREASGDIILVGHRLWGLDRRSVTRNMQAALSKMGIATFTIGKDKSFETFLSAHGLRKSGMSGLAESGATTLQIMSVSGHRTTKNVDIYVKDMERQRAAIRAVQLRQAMNERRRQERTNPPAEVVSLRKNKR